MYAVRRSVQIEWMGRMKRKRQVKKGRRRKLRYARKESGRVGRASRGATEWELKGRKAYGSSTKL
jgi:hypothetical protein